MEHDYAVFKLSVRQSSGNEILLCVCITDTLLVLGNPDQALTQVERGFSEARATGSMKYVARFHALRGEIALAARQWSQAEADCREALRLARQISYPTLTWQAAHLLAQAQAGQHNLEAASPLSNSLLRPLMLRQYGFQNLLSGRPSSPGRVCRPYVRSETISTIAREGPVRKRLRKKLHVGEFRS
jgi:hypothetical protein